MTRAFVTGGAAGIGAAIARRLAADGATVTVVDRDGPAAAGLAREIGGDHLELDLTDTDALAGLTLDVDILVNNAGVQHVAPIEEFDPGWFRRITTLMLEAPFLLTRAALPAMYERGFGRIVHVSSVHGLRASKYKAAYVAAKHGVEGLSKVTALEGGPHGVTSNCVNPGYVRTALVATQIAEQALAHGITEQQVTDEVFLARPAIKRLIEPDEVAGLVSWLCGPAAAMVTGASYAMDGGWTAN
ncbi:3-oxoacyl-[acyl-carrier-protein] reductase MabA OS=Tsukamurella paurometabola (strain ATCC 8368 /DSM / CCUG 35730 / CIP 100753 / JCM 10117 / KCTC 9821/ NBRC 16120 / NCIMB 702349 / NCTC 13040) OX=521096 GN=Tpau_0773 PE=3 SV=1 [Tsukamurella paurometabola]|uniref:3-oxoacyl-[acyl-carrier-protein] reductase MabA n=1 Tax=Tsukamurella paurometabola (strain ATCC 8368 / DSM 20162 / CCUG 35730 / CIP 100753 / JCM 10117 / KCTC 9821 / NBRC 16120 / NCIMB 702349 / NCTC 13040) TaxID=521096 RepID=D5UTQ5_TSUPD|nr:SDR family oxidoreductase [Tsukamurella paurometabola]ADG77409.1 short-chain dehydrogenase/reductase SDR [Tsukamurella paurometabola DSM 20162]SUP26932.1 D-beta-hydroxybutyrate dehydrogenase [Tsukamurella paurometabola]